MCAEGNGPSHTCRWLYALSSPTTAHVFSSHYDLNAALQGACIETLARHLALPGMVR